MKFKLFAILLIVMTGGMVATVYIPDFSVPFVSTSVPCEEPLTYRVGEIDERYDISEKELLSVMEKVEAVWSTAMDRPLLTHSKDGRVVINLVYGEEQQRSDHEKKFSQRIDVKRQQRQALENEFERMSRIFKSKKQDFQELQNEYTQKINKYNNYVAKWNGKSDVPEKVVRNIREMEREIKNEKARMQQRQRELESHRKRTNAKARRLNSVIEEEHELVSSYNKRYAKARKFNQGQFVKKGKKESVFIYQFSNDHDLKTVLAHEFGHAMGLDHVENPESIMYEMMDQQNIFNLSLTKEDIRAITTRCSE